VCFVVAKLPDDARSFAAVSDDARGHDYGAQRCISSADGSVHKYIEPGLEVNFAKLLAELSMALS
jgi:hypothetical protein